MAVKSHVEVAKVGVAKSFDDSHKSWLPEEMQKAVKKAIDASALFTTGNGGKGTKQFVIGGGMTLSKKDGDKSIALRGDLALQIGDWPEETMWGMAKGGAPLEAGLKEDLDKAVLELVTAILKDVVTKTAIPAMKNKL
jgi:hypothetical protein